MSEDETTKGEEGNVKAKLVEYIKVMAEVKDECADEDSAWRYYNEAEAAALRELAGELAALPDDDERLRRLATMLHGAELPWSLLDELLSPPGAHPGDDPGTPEVDTLLDDLLWRLEKTRSAAGEGRAE